MLLSSNMYKSNILCIHVYWECPTTRFVLKTVFNTWSRLLRVPASDEETQITSSFQMQVMDIGPVLWREAKNIFSPGFDNVTDTFHTAIYALWKLQVLQALMLIMDWRKAVQENTLPWSWQMVRTKLGDGYKDSDIELKRKLRTADTYAAKRSNLWTWCLQTA